MEAFSEEKLANSLRRSGADEATIEFVLADVKAALFEGMSTKRIYDMAFALLRTPPACWTTVWPTWPLACCAKANWVMPPGIV